MKIEIGCGESPRSGYVSCDVRDLPHVDYVCTADELPFNDNSIEAIHTRHVVEHFELKEFLRVLEEWSRVLVKGGEVYIICPNLLWHLEQILKGSHESFYNKNRGQNDRYWGFGSLFGWQQNKFDIHFFGYYYDLLKDILEEFGFSEIENLTNTNESMENAPWHLEVRAKKFNDAISHKSSKFYNHFDVKH